MFGSVRSVPEDLDLGELEVKTGQDAIVVITEVMDRQRRELAERRAREEERCSELHHELIDSVSWKYVVVDGAFARIVGCDLPNADARELVVPGELDGLVVRELASGACEQLANVERIVCADCIEAIGPSAFRACRDLRSLVLPRMTASFDSSWVNQCRNLEELILPGMLERVGLEVLSVDGLKRLTIGIGTHAIEPGAFANSMLEEVQVNEHNPFLATDCISIFERACPDEDGAGLRLVAVAVPVEEYEVPASCVEIGAKAFACCPELHKITLVDGVQSIGAHAFSRTKLRKFTAPSSLRRIEKRAFFRCRELESATLNEGLVEIDEEAFAESGITELHVSASVRQLACDCVARTGVRCVIEDGGTLQLDEHGVLYAKDWDKWTGHLSHLLPAHVDTGTNDLSICPTRILVGAMEPELVEYTVAPGCEIICTRAFANMPRLQQITLPEGVVEIGDAAFRGSRSLQRAHFPESLRSIGDEAFFDTALEGIYLPADFEHLGKLALVTAGARDVGGKPSLVNVQVNPNCERFYHTGGLLCERMGDGVSRVVLYDESRPDVAIPREVDTLAPFAFGNATKLSSLTIGTNVRHIQDRALNVNCLIEHIHVDFAEPIQGHDCIDLHFPVTFRSLNEVVRGFNSMTYFNAEALLARYDACVVNMHDYDAKSMAPIDLYGQLTRIIERLRDPLFLSDNTRRMYGQIIRDNLVEMCVAAARHDDRASVDALVELGHIDCETLLPVIEAVTKLQDAAMTGYLLELQRRLTGRGVDFEL